MCVGREGTNGERKTRCHGTISFEKGSKCVVGVSVYRSAVLVNEIKKMRLNMRRTQWPKQTVSEENNNQ